MQRLASTRLAPVIPRALLSAALSLSSLGCGPSFEAIQEGDLRFAHCDRLDLDPKIAPSHRLHCWREWRRVYTYGQTRDRVEYAQRRIAEVVSGDADPPFLLPDGTRTGRHSGPLAPSQVHSSPPAVVPFSAAEHSPSRDGDPVGLASTCRSQCAVVHSQCAPGCESQPTGCTECESSFQACLGNCRAVAP